MPSERVQRRIERMLDEADGAMDRSEWTVVHRRANEVLALDPENDEAAQLLRAAESLGISLASPGESSPPLQSVTDQPSTPTSFAAGRYTVSKFLGEGGKKKVYLAHDNTLDRDVAFALIKTEGLDDTSRERVKREAQSMGRMGTHPCIMPIYDLGEEPDANGIAQPFMVQPLMGGGDVEELIEDAGGPLPLEDALRIATQTAQGLVFAHGKGIVHRDLKPGNVWMDEDGAAKIGDFGLAVATDRSRLTVEKMMVGTVNYMPPEQATGGEVTPKADLYSLGAMLYEMATGRVPFMGDDDIAVISQHVNTPPVAPSWHNAAIPKTLDSLILRMMAKDPSERPESAEEVLTALGGIDLSVTENVEERQTSLDAMAGGVFVGRHREMDQLKAGFEEVLSGKGRMVTLVGEPGIGKTRTAQELATYASMRGASVLWGRSYESGGAPPYWPWVQAIRSHVAATESETLRNQLSSTAPVVAEVVPDVKAKLPDTPAPSPIEDPESARFRLFDSVSTFLKNTASSTPLVLMLEDLHWADKPSLMLLEFVARELANSRIMIVGNYRDMELNRRHPLSVTLGDLSRERLFERVVLRGLQRHDVERFIEIAAGITPPSALVDTVHSQTEGNPLFVTETVRLLIQEGDITSGQSTSGGTTSWEIRIPEGVREVIGRRLDRLSERTNEVLTIAAVIGRQFRFDVLKMLMEDTTDGQLLDAMDEALSARIIEELPDEVGFYQFTHAQMQETLGGELSHTRAVRMHAQIAEALEEHYGDAAEEHAAELVEHFAEAETVLGNERLILYSMTAGQSAMDAFAYEQAFAHYQRALDSSGGSDGHRTAQIHLGIARAMAGYLGRQEMQAAVNSLAKAFNYFVDHDMNAEAVDAALSNIPHIHGLTGFADILTQAAGMAPAGSVARGHLLVRAALWTSFERADYDAVTAYLKAADEIAEQSDDSVLLLDYFSVSGVLSTMYHAPKDAVDFDLKAIALAEKIDSPYFEITARDTGSQALSSVWRIDEARQVAAKEVTLAEQLGTSIFRVWAMVGLSSFASFEGDWEEARKWSDKALDTTPDAMRAVFPRMLLEAQTGNFEQVVKFLDLLMSSEFAGHPNLRPSAGPPAAAIAIVGRISGDFSHFHALEEQVRQYANSPTIEPYGRFMAKTALLFIAESQADKIYAASSYEELRDSYSGIFHYYLHMSGDRVLGIAAKTAEKMDEAAMHFRKAIELSGASGYRVEYAWSMTEYSELLLDRNAPGDHEKAIELQDEAISIATELGMKPLLERVLAKREILKA